MLYKGKMLHVICIATAAFTALTFTACGASIDIKTDATGKAAITCNAALGTAFMQVIRQMNGGKEGSPLMTEDDLRQMSDALSQSSLYGVLLRTPSNDSIEITGQTSLIEHISIAGQAGTEDMVQSAGSKGRGEDMSGGKERVHSSGITATANHSEGKGNLFTNTRCLTLTASSGKRKMTLALNAVTLMALYNGLNSDVQAYLDLFMSGVFSGEKMTREEWLDSLAVLYGKPFAKEAEEARVIINMALTNKGGKTAQKTFTVPLADILTGENVMCTVEG